ncbi:MAG: ATP-binding protein [Neptuniibacter sp.]
MIDVFAQNKNYVLANYSDKNLPKDCIGHPFIESLPIFKQPSEIIQALNNSVVIGQSEKLDSREVRLNSLRKLKEHFIALPRDGMLWGVLQREITSVYLGRYKADPNHYRKLLNCQTPICVGPDGYKPSFMVLKGASGAGKTTSINRVLSQIPQVIRHTNYNGYPFQTNQIPWIKIDCPHNGTHKPILIDIISQIHSLLGQDSKKPKMSRINAETLLSYVTAMFATQGVALLVIDNTENLVSVSEGKRMQLLNFLFNLYEKTGVFVVFIGTPEIESVIASELRAHRRSIEQDVPRWTSLSDRDWQRFIESLWSVQLTQNQTSLTDDLNELMREFSLGLPGIARPLFTKVQDEAIRMGHSGSGEIITPSLLSRVANEHLNGIYESLGVSFESGSLGPINKRATNKNTQTETGKSQKKDALVLDRSFLRELLKLAKDEVSIIEGLEDLGLRIPNHLVQA